MATRTQQNQEQLLPHNPELEKAVLGDLLIDPDVVWRAASVLSPDCFFIERNGMVYGAILALAEADGDIDYITVCEQLRKDGLYDEVGGGEYVMSLISATPTSVYADTHLAQLEDLARRRRLFMAAQRLAVASVDPDLPVDETITNITADMIGSGRDGTGRPMSELVGLVYDRFDGYLRNPLKPGEIRGIPTGIKPLDALLDGLWPGLYVLAARPSVGKTSIALQVAGNVAAAGRRVLVWSLEMTDQEVTARMICARSSIELRRVKRGILDEAEVERMVATQAAMQQWPLKVFDRGMTIANIRANIQRELVIGGADVIVVDSLNLMSGANRESNRNYELGSIARDFLLMSKEYGVPILAVHHLNRKVEDRANKRPTLSDLRDSGEIEQHADVVLACYRPGIYELSPREWDEHRRFYEMLGVSRQHLVTNEAVGNIMEIIVRKNRLDGPANVHALTYWNGPHMRVDPLQIGGGGREFAFD